MAKRMKRIDTRPEALMRRIVRVWNCAFRRTRPESEAAVHAAVMGVAVGTLSVGKLLARMETGGSIVLRAIPELIDFIEDTSEDIAAEHFDSIATGAKSRMTYARRLGSTRFKRTVETLTFRCVAPVEGDLDLAPSGLGNVDEMISASATTHNDLEHLVLSNFARARDDDERLRLRIGFLTALLAASKLILACISGNADAAGVEALADTISHELWSAQQQPQPTPILGVA